MRTTIFRGLSIALLLAASSAFAADFTLYDQDSDTGRGFDDDQMVAPVGGNEATTLGAQRMAALSYAAEIVFSRVASRVPIRIEVSFTGNDNNDEPLACERDEATLGQGGATQYSVNFSGAPLDDTAYPLALANALAGRRLADRPGISLTFNPRLDAGNKNCLQGSTWYYGLDGKPGDNQIDFVATAVHEFLHGLGFQTLVTMEEDADNAVGQFPQFTDDPDSRYSDSFSRFVQDLSMPGQPFWPSLSAKKRAQSMTHGRDLVWGNTRTDSAAAGYLDAGLNQGRIRLYAPDTIESSSSVSHWAIALSPNQIMEPREPPDIDVLHGIGLSACVLEDVGWQLANATRCPDVKSSAIAGGLDSGGPSSNSQGDSGGGGGGCTIDPDAAFDPLWLLMLGLAGTVLCWRRRPAPSG